MTAEPTALVLEGGTLIDGTGATPQRQAAIVIQGNRIQSVGPKGQVTYPPGAQVIDVSGKHIIPGLIDLHVHYRDWMPQLLVSHGVTSIADLSNDVDWIFAQKEGIAKGKIDGPRLFTAGQSIGAPPTLERVPTYMSGQRTVQETRQRARELLSRGADLLKAYTHITPAQLEAMTEEARVAGKRVIGHLNSLDAREAAQHGISALAHATGIAASALPDPELVGQFKLDNEIGLSVDYPSYLMAHADVDPSRLEQTLQVLLDHQVSIEFDLVNIAKGATPRCDTYELADVQLLSRPELQYLPEDFKLRALSYYLWRDLSEEELAKLRKGLEVVQRFVRDFVRAGGRLQVGTDIQAFVLPGISLHRELELLVDCGLSPMEVLVSATRANAEFLGQGNDLGTITPGKRADIVVIQGDPLADITATRNIEMVIQDGRIREVGYTSHFMNQLPRNVKEEWAGNPLPVIERLIPGVAVEGSDTTAVDIIGNNFIKASLVQFDGVSIPSTPKADSRLPGLPWLPIYTRLQAFIPRHLLLRPGTYPLTVTNPKPKGGTAVAYFIVKFS